MRMCVCVCVYACVCASISESLCMCGLVAFMCVNHDEKEKFSVQFNNAFQENSFSYRDYERIPSSSALLTLYNWQ